MLVTSSYQGRYAAHLVLHPKAVGPDGGKRVLSSKFCISGDKALKGLLEVTEEGVYRRLYGYGDLKVQGVRK